MLIAIHDVIHDIWNIESQKKKDIWNINPVACIRFTFYGYLKFSIIQQVYAVFCLLSDFILLIF